MKEEFDWECVHNHLPKWIKDYDDELDAIIGCGKVCKDLGKDLDRYNTLTDIENLHRNDPSALYGIEDEKEEIINKIVDYYTPYRKEAEELRKSIQD